MISKADILRRRDEILEIARRHGATRVRIFGSVAHDATGETSDLDLLVRFEPGRSLVDHGLLVEDLTELLNVHVDVVSEAALRPSDRFARRVIQDAEAL